MMNQRLLSLTFSFTVAEIETWGFEISVEDPMKCVSIVTTHFMINKYIQGRI